MKKKEAEDIASARRAPANGVLEGAVPPMRVEPKTGVSGSMLFSHGPEFGLSFSAAMTALHFNDPAQREYAATPAPPERRTASALPMLCRTHPPTPRALQPGHDLLQRPCAQDVLLWLQAHRLPRTQGLTQPAARVVFIEEGIVDGADSAAAASQRGHVQNDEQRHGLLSYCECALMRHARELELAWCRGDDARAAPSRHLCYAAWRVNAEDDGSDQGRSLVS